jgi:hypothetical protein
VIARVGNVQHVTRRVDRQTARRIQQ